MMPFTLTRTTTPEPSSLGRLATARALATDAACSEVVAAWRREGIESILLKGLTTAEWLYPSDSRGYGDADLLVAPSQISRAQVVLGNLGFVAAARPDSEHAHPWRRRSDNSVVDLHFTLWGANRSPARVWRELQLYVEPHRIGRVPVRVPTIPARALHLALHAAQHCDIRHGQVDLRRALERTSLDQWREAEQLADRLWALPKMAVGLQLEPAGRELLTELALARAALRAELDGASLAIGFARLATAQGLREKSSVIAHGLVAPAEDEDTERTSVARRTAQRILWLVGGLPRTVRSLLRSPHS